MTRLQSVSEKWGNEGKVAIVQVLVRCQIEKRKIPKDPENTPGQDLDMFLVKSVNCL